MKAKRKKIDYNFNSSMVNLQRAAVCSIPIVISIFGAIIQLPFPYGALLPVIYAVLFLPFMLRQIRSINSKPWQYFKEHPFMVKRPDELLSFQIDQMRDHSVEFNVEGCFEDIFSIKKHIDIIVDGLVYRYTKQPNGARYEYSRKRDVFWLEHDSWVYIGKENKVKPRDTFNVEMFKMGIFKQEKWYYIQFHDGTHYSGYMLHHLCGAIGVFANNNEPNEQLADELIHAMHDLGGTWDQIKEAGENSKVALYFEHEKDAQAAKEWLESRWTMYQFIKEV